MIIAEILWLVPGYRCLYGWLFPDRLAQKDKIGAELREAFAKVERGEVDCVSIQSTTRKPRPLTER